MSDRPLKIAMPQDLFDENGQLRLLSAYEYDQFDPRSLRMFCHNYARYLLPTKELVDFIKRYIIGSMSAIEIGSGCGDLGRHLGIRMTDNYCQERPDVQIYYAMTGQPTIKYGKDVEKIDALDAVLKYKPDIVIGAWVTHWIDPNLPPPPGGGDMYGIKEDEILKHVKKYIVIGAEEIHRHKPIMKNPLVKTLSPRKDIPEGDFIRSRRTDNRIWIWEQ